MAELYINADFDRYVDELQKRLFEAVMRRDVKELNEYLEMGVTPDSKNSNSRTALMVAAEMNDTLAMRYLLHYGADISATDCFGRTALHITDDLEATYILLTQGANVHSRDQLGRTPIHYAYDPDVIELLVTNGSAVNDRDENGETPLHHAASCGELNAIRAFVKLGADVTIENNRGWNAKRVAEESGCEAAMRLLEILS
jgi:ankyrin repeat protein